MEMVIAFQPGRGHWSRVHGIASELRARGHGVTLATSAGFGRSLGWDGPLWAIGPDWIEEDWLPEANGTADHAGQAESIASRFLTEAPRVAADLAAHCRIRRPDAMAFDYTLFGGPPVAAAQGIPWVGLYGLTVPFHPAGWPPFGSDLPPAASTLEAVRHDLLDRRINAQNHALYAPVMGLWREAGLALDSPWQAFAALPRLGIVGSSESCDFPWRRPKPANLHYVGPLLPPAVAAGPADPELEVFVADRDGGPLIHLTLGLAFSRQPTLLQRLIETLAGLDARLLVATGRLPAHGLPGGRTVLIRHTVDHARLFPALDLAVCHGGANTLMRAMAAGIPALVVPLGAEQRSNGARFRWTGLGDMILPMAITPDDIRSRVLALLARPRAQAQVNGVARAARLIEEACRP